MANLSNHQYADDPRPGSGYGNSANTVVCESNWGTDNLGAGDQHIVFTAARDCYVSNFVFVADDLDAHATPTLTMDVGTDTDDDEFIAATTVAQAGGSEATNTASTGTATEPRGFPLAAGEQVIVSVNAAAATAQAGSTRLYFDVLDIG